MSKRIFSQHIEQIWNNKDADGIERFIAPNYRGFDGDEVISGLEGYKQHFVTLTTGFPDLRITIRDMHEENRVAARFSYRRPIRATLPVFRPRESECLSQASQSSASVTATLWRSMRIRTGSG